MNFRRIPLSNNVEITTFYVVPCGGLKMLPIHRFGYVKFTFSGLLGLYDSRHFREQISAQTRARRHEGCRICQFLS